MNTIVEQLFNIPEAWYERTLYMARDSQMTYGNVRHLMLQTAAWLAEIHGVKPGQQVALCLPMGMTAAQVVLGVLASGASYLPLQFAGPSERLLEILADSDSVLLLTTKTMAKKLSNAISAKGPVPVVTIDPAFIAFSGMLERVTHLGRPIPADPEQPAAVFFTSGSTGQPKGIMMSRASMTATSFILAENMIVRAEDRMIMMAPLHYASSLGLFFPIPAGCSTYIVSEEEAMFPQVVAEILEREHISMWIGAATRLRLLAESGGLDCRDCSSVRYVEFFGEPMPIQSLHRAMRCFSNAKFQNTYGSSEAFWMSRFPVSDDLPAHLDALPIGKPLPCYEFFLCDENENTVAAGDVGEICVVGPVALTGYWKRPDLSAAARLNGISNSYRTGDLARLGTDGNYHFVGRRDHQVKIRGHRFELGEIETVLRSHASVRDAIAFLDGQEIRACVLAENRAGLTSEIRAICAQRLPVFARPKHVAVLDQFPQLASGKVDRMALQKASEIWGLH